MTPISKVKWSLDCRFLTLKPVGPDCSEYGVWSLGVVVVGMAVSESGVEKRGLIL